MKTVPHVSARFEDVVRHKGRQFDYVNQYVVRVLNDLSTRKTERDSIIGFSKDQLNQFIFSRLDDNGKKDWAGFQEANLVEFKKDIARALIRTNYRFPKEGDCKLQFRH
jgi:hypothetical protein